MEAEKLIKNLCSTLEYRIGFVCSDIDNEDARWRPENVKSPAIGWSVRNSTLFEDELSDFKMSTSGNFPEPFTLEELLDKLTQINGEIIKAAETKTDSWLDGILDDGFPSKWNGKSIREGLILIFSHGFMHAGQILEVKRLLGKGAWGY
ncbi:MAG: DinB family protein [Candidatus Hodarchaeales archaeon]|jgi:hypothetical protein